MSRVPRSVRIKGRYYQLLDYVQNKWSRFRVTEVGEALAWLAPRLLKASWLVLKLSMLFFIAFVIVSYGVLLFVLLILTGNGKAAISSFTKITLAVMALFAASRLIPKKPEVAKAVKALANP